MLTQNPSAIFQASISPPFGLYCSEMEEAIELPHDDILML